MFERIDHVGVAVDDLQASLVLYREGFGMREQHRETVEEFGVEAVLLEAGEACVELLRPLSPESGVGRFVRRNGPGLHHVAYRTDDIDSALDALQAAGMRLIDERPRAGVRNSRVAFVHPRATGGGGGPHGAGGAARLIPTSGRASYRRAARRIRLCSFRF